MHATIFVGSLKPEAVDSNTAKLSKRVQAEFVSYGVGCTLRYLRNRPMAHGTDRVIAEPGDEAGVYFHDIHRSDIILLATPTWWGVHSSLTQQLMERIGGYDDKYIETGKTPLYGKTFGCVITASNDGFQHIQGIMYAFAANMGFTIPPEASITWGTAVDTEDNPVNNAETENQVKNAVRNLVLWSRVLKKTNLGQVALNTKPGKVGRLSNDELARSSR
jgi:multimeric flavodoxin WrbA